MRTTSGGTQLSVRAGRLRDRARTLLAALATLSSGGCMVAAGYLSPHLRLGVSGLAMTVGGALMSLAFTLIPRGRIGPRRTVAETGIRTYTQSRGGVAGLPWPQAFGVMALTLGAGATMVLAGYAAVAWSWTLLIPLVLVGGLAILAALVLLAKQ